MGRFRLFALALLCAAGVAGVLAAGGFAAKSATTAAAVPQGTIPWIPSDGQDEDGAYVDPSRPSLHVHVYEHWAGSVEAIDLPAGMINCPSACHRNVPAGMKVTLRETPSGTGYTFDHWEGVTCEAPTTQTSRECTFTIPAGGELDVIAVYAGSWKAEPIWTPDPKPQPEQQGQDPGEQNQGEQSCEELFEEVTGDCEDEPVCEFFGTIYLIAIRPSCGTLAD
jgi:hypothetical protein